MIMLWNVYFALILCFGDQQMTRRLDDCQTIPNKIALLDTFSQIQ
jgi:hypothetical protein